MRMIITLFTLVLSFNAYSNEDIDCKALDVKAKAKYWHRVWMGEVVGEGRAQFYSAPHESCSIKGKFIIPKDGVGIYSEYDGFSQIIYGGKEEDAGVWVKTNRLKVVAKPDAHP